MNILNDSIKTFVQLGDLFDRRKYVNFNTLYLCKQYFFDRLVELDLQMIVFAGNHDIFYKNTLKVNSLNLLLGEYDESHVKIIDKPSTINIEGFDVCLLPWICDDNSIETFEHIRDTKAHICLSHLELSGFEMHKGSIHQEGMSADLFKKFDMVLSGHFHHRSSQGNITYVGTPYQMTWSDYGDTKGFHVLELDARQLHFIENPNEIFQRWMYSDVSWGDVRYLDGFAFENAKGCYIKVIVKEKTNPFWFDLFIERLEKAGAANIQVVDDHLNMNLEVDEDILDEAEDTPTILKRYVTSIELDVNKDALNGLLRSLYDEALTVE